MEESKHEKIIVSDQSLMNRTLSEEERKSPEVNELYQTFFEEQNSHNFTEERLYWLTKWIGTEMNQEKIEFLKNLWNTDFFHPFASPDMTTDMILSNLNNGVFNRFTISLSSSVPNMIRITFASTKKNGIVHRRMDISNRKPDTVIDGFMFSCPINFNTFVLLEEIKKLLIHHNPNHFKVFKPVLYSQCNEDLETPQPYADSTL
jgi:hypothetical protein